MATTESWTWSLPPDTSWALLLRWLDRYEDRVYRIRDQALYAWLPEEVGDGFLTILPLADDRLQLEVQSSSGTLRPKVEAWLRDWWDLDRDLTPFYEKFADDPLLGNSLVQNRGARIVGFPDLFEALVIGILGQQVNVAFAYQLKHRLTEAYGTSQEFMGETWWRFPRPDAMQNADLDQLRDMQISRRKAEYLVNAAGALARGDISKNHLLSLGDLDQQTAVLTSLRGIGAWTAHYVGMKCLHNPRAYPAGDAGLQNSVKALLQLDQKPSQETLNDLADSWRGWEAYATWFLWMS